MVCLAEAGVGGRDEAYRAPIGLLQGSTGACAADGWAPSVEGPDTRGALDLIMDG